MKDKFVYRVGLKDIEMLRTNDVSFKILAQYSHTKNSIKTQLYWIELYDELYEVYFSLTNNE